MTTLTVETRHDSIHGKSATLVDRRQPSINKVMLKTLFLSSCLVFAAINVGCTRKFSINDDRLIDKSARHDDSKVQISQNPDGTYHISGQVMMTFNPDGGTSQNIWADGVMHTWIGKVSYQGYIFDSDQNKPLTFRVDKDNGYAYAGGKGTVTSPDGKSTTLP